MPAGAGVANRGDQQPQPRDTQQYRCDRQRRQRVGRTGGWRKRWRKRQLLTLAGWLLGQLLGWLLEQLQLLLGWLLAQLLALAGCLLGWLLGQLLALAGCLLAQLLGQLLALAGCLLGQLLALAGWLQTNRRTRRRARRMTLLGRSDQARTGMNPGRWARRSVPAGVGRLADTPPNAVPDREVGDRDGQQPQHRDTQQHQHDR
jgi:hypothetical protein